MYDHVEYDFGNNSPKLSSTLNRHSRHFDRTGLIAPHGSELKAISESRCMIRRKYKLPVEALCIVAMFGMSACSEQPEDGVLLLSDEEIAFSLPEWTPMMQSRTDFFKENDLLDPGKGGGNFTLYAHVDGPDNTYIGGARVWYFNDPAFQKWIFLNGDEYPSPIKYYWPKSDKLNFFAFMPDSRYDGKDGYQSKPTHVNIGTYSEADGQTFSCDLPESVGYDTEIQEFIYAYEEPRTKDTVKLQFKHPFATVNFKVAAKSYRMTIESFEFSNMHLAGEFSTATGSWTPTDDGSRTYTAVINKRIPNGVNYATVLGAPFLVMPQKLDNVILTLTAHRGVDNKEEIINESVQLKDFTEAWLPGKQYVYIIKVGDNNSEIYFNVEVVDDWTAGGENNIDVE